MTNEEKINRLRNIQGQTPIYTSDDIWDLEALEAAIEAVETLDKIESRLGNVFEEEDDRLIAVNMFKELEAGIRADNELIAVSGMSVEELTDAFTKGYRLVSPEAVKNDVPDDLRIVPKNTREQTSWIPVTERLPDDYDRYLISTDDGMVEIVNYGDTNDLPNEIAFYQWDDEEWQCWKPNVTAWMPRPKAYKAESEGRHEI